MASLEELSMLCEEANWEEDIYLGEGFFKDRKDDVADEGRKNKRRAERADVHSALRHGLIPSMVLAFKKLGNLEKELEEDLMELRDDAKLYRSKIKEGGSALYATKLERLLKEMDKIKKKLEVIQAKKRRIKSKR